MEPIECSLKIIDEVSAPDKPKYGSYMRTWYSNARGLGSKKFAVALRVDVENLDQLLGDDHDPETIALGCVEFLNIIKQPKRGRRKKRPPYGNLELYFDKIPSWLQKKARPIKREAARVRIQEDDDGKYLAMIALTDERKVKQFAGTALKR
jgi:hypothetical protein